MALLLEASTDLKKKEEVGLLVKTTVLSQIETIIHLMDIVKPCQLRDQGEKED